MTNYTYKLNKVNKLKKTNFIMEIFKKSYIFSNTDNKDEIVFFIREKETESNRKKIEFRGYLLKVN